MKSYKVIQNHTKSYEIIRSHKTSLKVLKPVTDHKLGSEIIQKILQYVCYRMW